MITYISYILAKNGILSLNPIKYITMRFGLAIATSFISMLLIMPWGIRKLKSIQGEGQPIRQCGPETHLAKRGTPTMGGIFIVFSVILSSLLWADLTEYKIWICLLTLIIFCIIGFLDDYKKLKCMSSAGVSGKTKFIIEMIISGAMVYAIYTLHPNEMNGNLYFPIVKNFILPLGLLYVLFASIVITGSSNAVNLTDGLDGLVSMPIFLTALAFAIISYLCGDAHYSQYLHIFHIKNAGEIAIICGAIMGSCLGFLWFNSKPADIFMGDTGSLSLGATLGMIAVLTKHEIILFVVGFVFVIEAISVILQVGYFKLTKKRIFLMAPIHHHFEKRGLSETKVVARFWIMSFICLIIGLAMIKMK